MEIRSYEFNSNGRDILKCEPKGLDWPVVYLINNDTDLYIGETTSAAVRMNQHLKNVKKSHLKTFNVVFDDTFNKSVVLDFEQRLIKYARADKKFNKVLNGNVGQSAAHNYYDRDSYNNVFSSIWNNLKNIGLANNDLGILENKIFLNIHRTIV